MRSTKLERPRKSLRRHALVEYRYNGQRWSVRISGLVRLPPAASGLPSKVYGALPEPSDPVDAAAAAHRRPAQERAGRGGCPSCEATRRAQAVRLAEQAARIQQLEAQLKLAASTSPAAREACKVVISYIHYLGATKRTQADEFVELYNSGDEQVDLAGWQLEAGAPGQAFTFPPGTVLAAEQRVRIFTDQEPREPGSFSFRSKRALWNDDGDLGRLLDASGVEICRYGYGAKETRSIATITSAHGVAGLQVIHDPQHLEAQHSYRGRIDFLTALERAIRCLLEEPGLGAQSPRRRADLKTQSLRLLHDEDLPADNHARLRRDWLFRLQSSEPKNPDTVTIAVARSGIKPAAFE